MERSAASSPAPSRTSLNTSGGIDAGTTAEPQWSASCEMQSRRDVRTCPPLHRAPLPPFVALVFTRCAGSRTARHTQVERSARPGARRFLVRASYLQIYNEVLSDLLKPGRNGLVIREDLKKGLRADGLSEWVVRSPAEAGDTAAAPRCDSSSAAIDPVLC